MEIPLSRGLVALVDDEDFELVSQYRWYASPYNHTFYARTKITDDIGPHRTVYMHRLVLDAKPGSHVDHRSGNGLDNQRHNIRLATKQQNCHNQRIRSDNKSGFKGVSLNQSRKSWVAQIKAPDGRTHRRVDCPSAAHAGRAYDEMARQFFGPFAWLNFPKQGEH